MLKLVLADSQYIGIIQELANDIWWKYYSPIIGYKQVQYMLDKFYSDVAIKHQMFEKKHQFFIINWNKKNIGFISVEKQKNGKLFIHKFYILQSKANKGIGTKVFRKIIQMFQPKEVRLTVNRQNFKAINFYFKNKFIIEKVADFDIGNGFYMNDFVMVWKKKH
ncbi:MAG: N-acetyltransferase [Bacteroidia bacterium]|nr:MAG: N-acetyltransferase [Bacteroidia bacterium]